jgi:hypothetical protein
MVSRIQVQTATFMRTQSGEVLVTTFDRTWHSKDNLARVRRNDSGEGGTDVEEQRHEGADLLEGDGLGVQVEQSRGFVMESRIERRSRVVIVCSADGVGFVLRLGKGGSGTFLGGALLGGAHTLFGSIALLLF